MFGERLADGWCAAYSAQTTWRPEILEIELAHLTFLFVRPMYRDGSWIPTELEMGNVRDGALTAASFVNR